MKKIRVSYLLLGVIILFSFRGLGQDSSKNEQIELSDGNYVLRIKSPTFQIEFENTKAFPLIPSVDSSSLLLNGYAIVSTLLKSNKNSEEKIFNVLNTVGEKAEIIVSFENEIVKFSVVPENDIENNVTFRLGGMPVAHGLGDAGAFRESFNLIENKSKTYSIVNNGGGQRWVSSFVVFPKNNIAGVFFNKGSKTVILSENEYEMHSQAKGKTTFYYFVGDLKSIYKNYKRVREQEGYSDVEPKFKLFELGWESWDALGWNTNQKTVQEILEKFQNNDYPIRWAVTGSGFWDQGGTTTSFGKWGEKFPDAMTFKNWMHSKNIKWIIGLRTNFIPEGGPYYPKTEKRDKNLKVNSFYGNELTGEAKMQGYLVKDKQGQILHVTSEIFPIVPSNLLDGNVPGAAEWYQQQYTKWDVDGIKEDTMMKLDSLTGIYNAPISEISQKGGLVMARNGEYSSPGSLLRINDTGVGDMVKRIPITYLQYAASGFPNVYSDVAGVHNMNNLKDLDKNIRHTWLLSLTSGLAVGAYPENWPENKQKSFKKAIDFHYRLAPYMYSTALAGYNSGFPTTLIPLTLAFPEDPNVTNIPNYQWMIGESILAAPLLKNSHSGKMDVYLPEGVWFDYETGKKYEGSKVLVNYEIPLEKTPIFIGGKGIIVERTVDDKPLKARIYPISESSKTYQFIFPENKGVSKISFSTWSSLDKVKVRDVTINKEIYFEFDDISRNISFEIIPNHNYQIEQLDLKE